MRPYPVYKDSGIDWLGGIPRHWIVSPLKYVVNANQEVLTENTDTDYEIRYVDIGNVTQEGLIAPPTIMRFEDAPSRARRIVRSGDTIVSTVRTYLKAIAYFPCAEENLIVSTGFAVLTPTENVIPKFLHYLVSSQQTIETITANSVGVSYPAINSSELVAIPVCFPPNRDEQQVISDYLDRKTAAIDTLIAKKEQQIALLQEQRTAVINQAVTKGLNPNAPVKDSGIPLLDCIPTHWNLSKLKFHCSTTKGFAFDSEAFAVDGVPVVKATDIKNESIRRASTYIPHDLVSSYKKTLLKEGDIVISTVGSQAHVLDSAVGQLAMVPREFEGALLNQNTVILRPLTESKVENLFLFSALRSNGFRKYLDLYAHGTANQASLNLVDILDYPLAIPPIEEQGEIIQLIQEEQQRIDQLIQNQDRQIELLKEYRTAVISAAVTGKIDVRDAR
jgi:type I restriction enzyme S subunit